MIRDDIEKKRGKNICRSMWIFLVITKKNICLFMFAATVATSMLFGRRKKIYLLNKTVDRNTNYALVALPLKKFAFIFVPYVCIACY